MKTQIFSLFETIIKYIPEPPADSEPPFQMLVMNIEYNDYIGRLGIRRIFRGTIKDGAPMRVIHKDGRVEDARITKIYTFEGLKRNEVMEASAGEIIALPGMEDVDIGETICDPADITPLHS